MPWGVRLRPGGHFDTGRWPQSQSSSPANSPQVLVTRYVWNHSHCCWTATRNVLRWLALATFTGSMFRLLNEFFCQSPSHSPNTTGHASSWSPESSCRFCVPLYPWQRAGYVARYGDEAVRDRRTVALLGNARPVGDPVEIHVVGDSISAPAAQEVAPTVGLIVTTIRTPAC